MPIQKMFRDPVEDVLKLNENNNLFQSYEIVGALNACLYDNNLFSLESHYSGVYNEYLNYAKLRTHTLHGESYILATKTDYYISKRRPMTSDVWLPHTYIERKALSDYEYMWAAREQCIRYVCLGKVWPTNMTFVYGIHCLGLNVEYIEYNLGNKGILGVQDKYVG